MSETSPSNSTSAPPPLQSKLGKRWVFQMILYIVGLEAFAGLCLYDALLKYPARGANAAAFNEYRYLSALENSDPGALAAVNVTDPDATMKRLKAKADLIGADQSLNDWLTQLGLIGKLSGDHTKYPRTDYRKGGTVGDPVSRLKELRSEWETAEGSPKTVTNPLTTWDIPSQWVMLALCAPGGLWVLVTFMRAASKTYKWDPATHTMTLPGNHVITPADLADVDKRKWDKLYVHLRFKPNHATLGGKEIELDLKRYEPIEEWVLAMEAVAFPDRAEKAEPPASESDAPTQPSNPTA
ncbi:MAG: hypothetical protein ACOYN0_00200 [Phycisphaerales bacterium]